MKTLKHLYQKFNCKRIVKKHIDYKREKYNDRRVLEEIIFPFVLADHDPKSILDIGREDYQSFYNEFFEGRELWTLDRKPTREEFGAEKHITGDVAYLKKYFEDNKFDLIIMNGVFGWGLNDPKLIEQTFAAIYDILKPHGIFIFGYNDFPDKPMAVEDIQELKKLQPLFFKPLNGASFKCENGEHTYNFYQKI